MRNGSRIADVFDAKQAFRVTGSLLELCRRDVSGVFLGLREVDGNFQLAVFRVGDPVLILCDAVAADVVAVLTQLIEIIRRRFWRLRIERPELPHNFRRTRRDTAHEPRIKQIALRNGVRDHALFRRIVTHNIQTFRKIIVVHLLFVAFELQFRKQAIPCKCLIKRVQQLAILRVIEQ